MQNEMVDRMNPWGFGTATLGILLVFGTFLGLRIGLDLYDVVRPGTYATISASLVALGYAIALKYPLGQMGWRFPTNIVGWIWVVALGVLSVVGLQVYALFVIVPLSDAVAALTGTAHHSSWGWLAEATVAQFALVMVVVVWIGAAIGEEWLMRGFLLSALESMFGGTRVATFIAAIVQSVIFGVLHYEQGAVGIVITGLVGFYLTAIYFIGGRRLLPVILAHGLIDTISLTTIYLSGA
ncbi:MAG: CPBP family intramembrane metalloprotease [Parvularculaceae bacterium]|nr:CPBP family intramembrane metalloprotease [Parvularculaceae bacterium]